MTAAQRVQRTGAAIRDWWLDPEERHEENSNSLAIVILLLPVILGAFGLGFDISRNVYVRTALQGALDMALASGATVTTPNPERPGQLAINPDTAPETVIDVYSLNREANVGLKCVGVLHCWREPMGPPQVTPDEVWTSISYTVEEETSNFFLNVVGIPTQTYEVAGTAEITSRNE